MAKKKRGSKKQQATKPKKKARAKRHIRLMVIPEPEPNTRTVFHYTGEGTVVMRGRGKTVMECGSCGVPLVIGLAVSEISSLVFRCPNCGEFNETLT